MSSVNLSTMSNQVDFPSLSCETPAHATTDSKNEEDLSNLLSFTYGRPPGMFSVVKDNFTTDNILVTDMNDDGYKCYHYGVCDGDSDMDTRANRGIIRHNDNIVCKTFGYTPEIVLTSEGKETLKGFFEEHGLRASDLTYYSAIEGTLIRVWHHDDKWFVSSHKKIDAFRSRWGCAKSHGEIFKEAVEHYFGKIKGEEIDYSKFLESLDKSYIYTFVVRSTYENRIVSLPPSDTEPHLFFVGRFNTSDFSLSLENPTSIPSPSKYSFSDLDSLISYIDSLSPQKAQGVLFYHKVDDKDEIVKIVSSAYKDLEGLRDNTPSVNFRYLQVRTDPLLLHKFVTLYEDRIAQFREYERIIRIVEDNIYRAYVARFVRHEYVVIPQDQFYIMKDLHDQYLRTKNIVTREDVSKFLNTLSAVRVNYLIKSYKAKLQS